MEDWKTYEIENRYLNVSSRGIIKNEKGKILKLQIHKRGHPVLSINFKRDDGSIDSRKLLVQRLVALTFIPNPDNKEFVCQKDGDKLNISVENLFWATKSESIAHHRALGKNLFKSKLIPREVLEIKQKLRTQSASLLARKYQISIKQVYDIKKGTIWRKVLASSLSSY